MVYGIALCTYSKDGLYSWSLLDEETFRSRGEAIGNAREFANDNGWKGSTTYSDSDGWNWRREDNDGEMDDLCLVAGKDLVGLMQAIRQLG